MEKSRWKWSLWGVLLALLVALLILFALIPTILSTRWGNELLFNHLSGRIPGQISAKSLTIRWLGPQVAQGVILTDPEGSQVAKVERVSVEAGLWSLIWGSRNYGQVALDYPVLTLEVAPEGSSNLDRALGCYHLPAIQPLYAGLAATPTLVPTAPTGSLHLNNGAIHASEGGAVTTIDQIELRVDHLKGGGRLRVVGQGKNVGGGFEVDLDLNQARPSGRVTTEKLPVLVIDQLATIRNRVWRGFLTDLLGDWVDLHATVKDGRISGALEGPRLSGSLQATYDKGRLTLDEPADLAVHLHPDAAQYLFSHVETLRGATLTRPTELALHVAKCDLTMEREPSRLSQLTLETTFAAAALDLNHPTLGSLNIASAKGKLATESLDSPVTVELQIEAPPASFSFHAETSDYVDQRGTLRFPQSFDYVEASAKELPVRWISEELATLLGPRLSFSFTRSNGEILVEAQSDQLELPKTLLAVGDQGIALAKEMAARYTLTPEIWKRGVGADQAVQLKEAVPLTINLQQLRIPHQGSWRTVDFEATVSAAPFVVTDVPRRGDVTVDEFRAHLDAQPLSAGKFRLIAILASEGRERLPIDADGRYTLDKEGRLTLPRFGFQAEGRDLEVLLVASYKDEKVELLSPLYIHRIISNALINEYYPGHPNLLRQDVDLKMTINPGDLQLDKLNWSTLKMVGIASTSEVLFGGQRNASLKDLNARFQLDMPADKAQITFSGSSHVNTSSGKFTGELDFSHFANGLGKADLSMDIAVDRLPIEAVMLMVGSSYRAHQAEALFGSSASLRTTAKLEKGAGPISFDLRSENANALLRGRVNDQTLYLTAPLDIEASVTPAVGEYILSDINPLFTTAKRSERPIRFHIEPQGFALPLAPLTSELLQVGSGTLDLGKIWVENRDLLNNILSIFKGDPIAKQEELLLWSTPAHFTITDGVIHLARMDTMIGDGLQMAAWGDVNLHSGNVNLRLGVPGPSLRKILRVADIPDDYTLILKVRGTVEDPEIDLSTAVPRIGALLARREGAAGKIAGNILEIIGGNLQAQKRVPAPTTQPYPWANDPNYAFPPYKAPPRKKVEKKVKDLIKEKLAS